MSSSDQTIGALSGRPDAAVLIVSAAATAAATAALGAYVVLSIPKDLNGLAEPLRGRNVDLWPDANDKSRDAFAKIAGKLLPIAGRVRVVNTTEANAADWNIATAIDEGWTAAELISWGKPRLTTVETPPPEKPKPVETKKIAGSEIIPSAGVPAYVLWEQLQLARNDRGPYATEANALRIIAAHDAYAGRIWLDEFSQRLMIDETPVDQYQPAPPPRLFSRTDAISMLVWMQEALQLPKMPLSCVERAAVLVGERNKRHPLRNWLSELKWDGVDRLPALLADAWGADQTAYTAAVGRCWFVAMVARVFDPGCKADHVPVFEGPQGTTKSTALSILGGQWFLETTKNPVRDPDRFLQSLQGKWLIEIPEIDRIGGKHGDLSDLTGLITIRNDTYRMPYAPTAMDYPRQCIFVGTANRSSNWQPDETGGRRYWPTKTGTIDLDYLRDSRTQLFAEAVHRYQAGESWWDVPQDEAMEQQEQRRVIDQWEGVIERYMIEYPDRRDWQAGVIWNPRKEPLKYVTVSMILEDAMGLSESKWDMLSQKRVVRCFSALKLTQQRPTIDGKRTWVYAKANTFAASGS